MLRVGKNLTSAYLTEEKGGLTCNTEEQLVWTEFRFS